MSKKAGKGPRPRPYDTDKWNKSPLWKTFGKDKIDNDDKKPKIEKK